MVCSKWYVYIVFVSTYCNLRILCSLYRWWFVCLTRTIHRGRYWYPACRIQWDRTYSYRPPLRTRNHTLKPNGNEDFCLASIWVVDQSRDTQIVWGFHRFLEWVRKFISNPEPQAKRFHLWCMCSTVTEGSFFDKSPARTSCFPQ